MKWTTPGWIFNKYKNRIINEIFPLRSMKIDSFTFHYLRNESPPQDPREFSARGLEFHGRIEDLAGRQAIDVGANIGSYTLRLSRRFNSVMAFEPSPRHCEVLRRNVRTNRIQNVRIQQIALSDVGGVEPLYLQGGATTLDPHHYDLTFDKVTSTIVAKLDDFQPELRDVDFMKLDAENSEYKILKGGTEVISHFRPILAIEVHQARVELDDSCGCRTCDLVTSLGYDVEVTGEFSSVGQVHWVWAHSRTPGQGRL